MDAILARHFKEGMCQRASFCFRDRESRRLMTRTRRRPRRAHPTPSPWSCRAHAAPMTRPCTAHAPPMPRPCTAHAAPVTRPRSAHQAWQTIVWWVRRRLQNAVHCNSASMRHVLYYAIKSVPKKHESFEPPNIKSQNRKRGFISSF